MTEPFANPEEELRAPQEIRQRARRPRRADHAKRGKRPVIEATYADIARRAGDLFQTGFWVALAASVLGLQSLLFSAPDYIAAYLAIVIPTLIGLRIWAWSATRALPLLPIFLIQQALVYSIPLVFLNSEVEAASKPVVGKSGLAVGLFLCCLLGGWRLAIRNMGSKPSIGNLELGKDSGRLLSLSFSLLAVALAFHLSTRTGLLFSVLAGSLGDFFSIIRTFAETASMLGALLGGLAVGGNPASGRTWLYWLLIALIGVMSIADILLSGASGMVLAAAVGLALGMRRIPWRFLVVTFMIFGFLNQGKFVMRGRYWDLYGGDDRTTVGLVELPAFFAEWTAASANLFFGGKASDRMAAGPDDEGQSLISRINNMQNVTYVVEAIDKREFKPLWGETYTLIPPLLVPRIFWADKPRTHEGQILLNLHFGRQESVKQTEGTYIAWGLLPEAIGNFGIWLGPAIGGLVYGFLIGAVEAISRRKRMLSVEGMLLATLMLLLTASYEMVASVFVTAAFQALIAVLIGSSVLRVVTRR